MRATYRKWLVGPAQGEGEPAARPPQPLSLGMAAPTIPARATWADIGSHYEELSSRTLDAKSIRAWLDDFSALDEAVEIASRIPGATFGTVEVRPLIELGERFDVPPDLAQ